MKKETKLQKFERLYSAEIKKSIWITKDRLTEDGFFPSYNSNGKDIRFIKRKYKLEEFKSGNKITKFKVIGLSYESKREIRTDIRRKISSLPCAFLETKSNIEVDHKNGRYNDDRVLNTKTQTFDDFQPLSKIINNIKREECKKCKDTEIRFDARKYGFLIPNLNNEPLHNGKPNGCEGCFFYDVVEFKKEHFKLSKLIKKHY